MTAYVKAAEDAEEMLSYLEKVYGGSDSLTIAYFSSKLSEEEEFFFLHAIQTADMRRHAYAKSFF